MAEHVLRHGLQGASLRPLASAAGTSDRMLLYYFRDKEDLIEAVLTRVVEGFRGLLDPTVAKRKPLKALLPEFAALLRSNEVRPHMQLWMEMTALSSRGEEPFRRVAGAICDGFLEWLALRIRARNESERRRTAAFRLCLLEGMLIFDSLDRGRLADAAITYLAPVPRGRRVGGG